MVPDISRWRSSATYDFVDDLVSPDLAWEWLRRNQKYQHDYRSILSENTEAAAGAAQLQKHWGLCFPDTAFPERQRRLRILDAVGRYRHRAPYGFAVGRSH